MPFLADERREVVLDSVHVVGAEGADDGTWGGVVDLRGELWVEREVDERLAQERLQQLHLSEWVAPSDLDVEEDEGARRARGLDIARDDGGVHAAQIGAGAAVGLCDGDDRVDGRDRVEIAVEGVVLGGEVADGGDRAAGRVETERAHEGDPGETVEGDDLRTVEDRGVRG